jgi:hypothetical protein
MAVWTENPKEYTVSHPSIIQNKEPIYTSVKYNGLPADGARVTLLGGWRRSSKKPVVFMSKTTTQNGTANFSLSNITEPIFDLSITVTGTNVIPYIGRIKVNNYKDQLLLMSSSTY